MIILPTNINKKKLWQYVNLKTKRLIHHYHVFGVINILFDEMLNILKRGEDINIFNFGVLSLKKMNPRTYYDVRFQKKMKSKGRRVFRFKLSPKLNKKLNSNLDMDKTFNNE